MSAKIDQFENALQNKHSKFSEFFRAFFNLLSTATLKKVDEAAMLGEVAGVIVGDGLSVQRILELMEKLADVAAEMI